MSSRWTLLIRIKVYLNTRFSLCDFLYIVHNTLRERTSWKVWKAIVLFSSSLLLCLGWVSYIRFTSNYARPSPPPVKCHGGMQRWMRIVPTQLLTMYSTVYISGHWALGFLSMDFTISISINLWSVEHFLDVFVITFGLLGGCNIKATTNLPKSDDKNGQEMFNWSEVHWEKEVLLMK